MNSTIPIPSIEWTAAERANGQPPESLLPSQWAERYRTLTRRQSSQYGRWRNAQRPHLVAIMDLPFVYKQIRKMNVKKAGQEGVSEALRNVIGYVADREPDPAMLNLPDEKSGKGVFKKRILPLFQDTQRLKNLSTDAAHDQTSYSVTLSNGFEVMLAWSGSPTTLASNPIRFVFNDEVDKMQSWMGNEADALSLAEVRTATYSNSLIFNVSTPTIRGVGIDALHEASPIKLWFYVPCPHCGREQRLIFDRLRWEKYPELADKKQRAAAIETHKAAWYECEYCQKRITDQHKPRMVAHGHWATADGGFKFYVDGRIVGDLPDGTEVGIQTSGALASLAAKHKFYLIAAEFVKCDGDLAKTQNFRNSWLGEVFELQLSKTRPSAIRDKIAAALPPLIVPDWAGVVIATADTQKDHFYFTIRAWGYEYQSALIHNGMCVSFDELFRVCLEPQLRTQGGNYVKPAALLIDSGGTKTDGVSRTEEVYKFALTDPGRIVPCKGASQAMRSPWTMSRMPIGLMLRLIDTNYYKDMLARLIKDEQNASRWMPHNAVTEDYCQQLAAEHKVLDRKKGKQYWVPITSGAANHYLDCEVLQCAAADMANVGLMKPAEPEPPDNSNSRVAASDFMNRGRNKW